MRGEALCCCNDLECGRAFCASSVSADVVSEPRRRFYMEQRLPTAIAASVARTVLPSSSPVKRGMQMLSSGLTKASKVADALHPFSYQEWIFDQKAGPQMLRLLSQEERKQWLVDVTQIDWRQFVHSFFFGIAKFILQEPSGKHLFFERMLTC